LMIWFPPKVQLARSHNKIEVYFALYYLIVYPLGLMYFVLLQIFRPDLIIQKPVVMAILMICILLLGLLTLLLYFDLDVFSQIITTKNKRNIFIAAAIVTLLFSPYMSGKVWGSFKGLTTQLTDFPQVELYANKQLTDGIKWVSTDKLTYKSDQELYLIAKTTDYIFLKSSNNANAVYVLKPSDILSITILNLGKPRSY